MKDLINCRSLIMIGIIAIVVALGGLKEARGKSEKNSGNPSIIAQIEQHDTGVNEKLDELLGADGSDCPNAWSKIIPDANERFEIVMNGKAVLDKETCLVWEQSPDTTVRTWIGALTHCFTKKVGGRKGWRAPTIEELATLVDDTQGPPTLPSGHPFDTNAVQSSFYWSSTTDAGVTAGAWVVDFSNGGVSSGGFDKGVPSGFVWCVRGGQGHDAY